MAGRVKASARNSTSGWVCFTVSINHCQKFRGLVCGLSTRKMCTPRSTHSSVMRRISADSPAGSLSKLSG